MKVQRTGAKASVLLLILQRLGGNRIEFKHYQIECGYQ